ncbi:hypothetical protein BV898_08468 [Hypsibius exemplaris]|uniref:Uncharacterized protein n=1 Tax=Hypsibius exemplaris TaxID=2072580 RepID=A0A1W0WQD4_HYPEX|nr:hypothetical protein BV898_08468 [Hypsibius exemplaris]
MDFGSGNHRHRAEERDIYLSYADSYMMWKVVLSTQIGTSTTIINLMWHIRQKLRYKGPGPVSENLLITRQQASGVDHSVEGNLK